MITCYFGVPGCGKTTLLTKIAVDEICRIHRGKSRYKAVYTNFYCVGAYKLDFSVLDTYLIKDSLLLFDELTLDADNRSFKSFPAGVRDFFILHRHASNDIIYATQNYQLVDKKIRDLTADLWYVEKGVVPFFRRWTKAKKIYREITINEYTSELILGYRFCKFLEGIFNHNRLSVYRPKYYKYYDSWDLQQLSGRPLYSSSLYSPFPYKSSFLFPFRIASLNGIKGIKKFFNVLLDKVTTYAKVLKSKLFKHRGI